MIPCIFAGAGRGTPTARFRWNWQTATIPTRTGYGRMKSALVSDVDRLLVEQSLEWPLLKRGMQGLQASQTRGEFVTGRTILVRHIPHRIKSTTAAVDAASISRRACFLCAGNLDPEEKGIPFGAELTIYCNPF